MQKILFLLNLLKKELSSRDFLLRSILVSLVYAVVAIYLINLNITLNILENSTSIFSKIQILILFLWKHINEMPSKNLYSLIFIAILFGLNFQLIFKKLNTISKSKHIHFTFGLGILSIGTTGCASCGLSIISFLGLGGTTAMLPLKGFELSIISIVALIASLFYNLNSFAKECKIVKRS